MNDDASVELSRFYPRPDLSIEHGMYMSACMFKKYIRRSAQDRDTKKTETKISKHEVVTLNI